MVVGDCKPGDVVTCTLHTPLGEEPAEVELTYVGVKMSHGIQSIRIPRFDGDGVEGTEGHVLYRHVAVHSDTKCKLLKPAKAVARDKDDGDVDPLTGGATAGLPLFDRGGN